ncbi:MAG: cytochrome-c peroxidase [Mariprofundaceae bacterium]|nr:cytochrome-c peroxidase [Mariprofundaceae bacterium]
MQFWKFYFCTIPLFFIAPNIALADTFQSSESYILPITKPLDLDEDKIKLGRALFHEKRLSSDNSISCAHCHNLASGGVDGLSHSLGVAGAKGSINAPTVYNAVYNLAQFWDGRAETLEDQIDHPIKNPVEMAANWPDIIKKLEMDVSYSTWFKNIYGRKGITSNSIKNAIATFERSLVTYNAPFDRFLLGDKTAISNDAKKGYALFQSYGCVSCHQGINVGGNMFQTMGVFGDYFDDRGNITKADAGRFAVTGRPKDQHKFKVPSLRLVTLTAPYFHDGSIDNLSEAIQIMARYELGRMIPDDDIQLIIAFLKTLKGETQAGGKP